MKAFNHRRKAQGQMELMRENVIHTHTQYIYEIYSDA